MQGIRLIAVWNVELIRPSLTDIVQDALRHPRCLLIPIPETPLSNLTRFAGPLLLHPVSLLPGEDWKRVRSICDHRVTSSAPEHQAGETH